jgi:hypothetical protein
VRRKVTVEGTPETATTEQAGTQEVSPKRTQEEVRRKATQELSRKATQEVPPPAEVGIQELSRKAT